MWATHSSIIFRLLNYLVSFIAILSILCIFFRLVNCKTHTHLRLLLKVAWISQSLQLWCSSGLLYHLQYKIIRILVLIKALIPHIFKTASQIRLNKMIEFFTYLNSVVNLKCLLCQLFLYFYTKLEWFRLDLLISEVYLILKMLKHIFLLICLQTSLKSISILLRSILYSNNIQCIFLVIYTWLSSVVDF